MNRRLLPTAVLFAALAAPAPSLADDGRSLSFGLDENYRSSSQPEVPAPAEGETPPPEAIPYGRAGGKWWTIGAGVANDFDGETDVNVHGAWSWFLADELEWGIELAGWAFFQDGDDTGGVSGSLLFRWHFLHDEEYTWTVFGDVGIGMLGSFSTVPDGGTGFNFLPRAGMGATFALDEQSPCRLMVGARWHHISNGRIEGDTNNPARDSLMLYAAVVFPF